MCVCLYQFMFVFIKGQMRQMGDLFSTEIVRYLNKTKKKYIREVCFIISSICLAGHSILYYALIIIKVLK